jgi:hypothetical protein
LERAASDIEAWAGRQAATAKTIAIALLILPNLDFICCNRAGKAFPADVRGILSPSTILHPSNLDPGMRKYPVLQLARAEFMDIRSLTITLVTLTVSTALSLGGLYLVRKNVELSVLKSYHEVAGYLLSVIGTLYAVLLGFVVVDSLSKFDRARVLVEEEANGIANVFFLADNFPAPERREIHVRCLRYIDAVIDEEWKTMRDGEPSRQALHEMQSLWSTVSKFEPKNQNNTSLWEAMLSSMDRIGSNRRLRLITAKFGLSPVMATVIIIGATITIMFTYFFGLEKFRAQAIMTALVSLTLSLNVCLVLLYGYPFRQGIEVQPSALLFDRFIITTELKRRGETDATIEVPSDGAVLKVTPK